MKQKIETKNCNYSYYIFVVGKHQDIVIICGDTNTNVRKLHDSTKTSQHATGDPTTQQLGWRFGPVSPWRLDHTRGSGQDIHSTRVPGSPGRLWMARYHHNAQEMHCALSHLSLFFSLRWDRTNRHQEILMCTSRRRTWNSSRCARAWSLQRSVDDCRMPRWSSSSFARVCQRVPQNLSFSGAERDGCGGDTLRRSIFQTSSAGVSPARVATWAPSPSPSIGAKRAGPASAISGPWPVSVISLLSTDVGFSWDN